MRYHPYHASVSVLSSQTVIEPAPLTRRLLSLTGVIPLGAFLLVHLLINASAVHSNLAFAKTVDKISQIPALALIEGLFIFAPLVVHGAIGVWFVVAKKRLTSPSAYNARVGLAMRITGIVAIVFLAMHLPELRFRANGAHHDGGQLATFLAYDLSSVSHGIPFRGLAYLAGTACVVFHFSAGLWGFFAASRQGRASARARQTAVFLAVGLGAALWLGFADIVVFYATGVGFL